MFCLRNAIGSMLAAYASSSTICSLGEVRLRRVRRPQRRCPERAAVQRLRLREHPPLRCTGCRPRCPDGVGPPAAGGTAGQVGRCRSAPTSCRGSCSAWPYDVQSDGDDLAVRVDAGLDVVHVRRAVTDPSRAGPSASTACAPACRSSSRDRRRLGGLEQLAAAVGARALDEDRRGSGSPGGRCHARASARSPARARR